MADIERVNYALTKRGVDLVGIVRQGKILSFDPEVNRPFCEEVPEPEQELSSRSNPHPCLEAAIVSRPNGIAVTTPKGDGIRR